MSGNRFRRLRLDLRTAYPGILGKPQPIPVVYNGIPVIYNGQPVVYTPPPPEGLPE